MQSLLEGRSVVDVFVKGEAYPVLLTSNTRPLDDPTDLENVFLKTGDGKIVPMSVIASLTESSVAPQATTIFFCNHVLNKADKEAGFYTNTASIRSSRAPRRTK